MEFMWAPWRIEYILSEKDENCIFCYKPKENKDRDNLLLYRGERNMVMLNKYPYNPGHLMVAPYKHVSSLDALDDEELQEHFKLVNRCVEMMKEEMHPEGFNIGINLGKVAGAGIEKGQRVFGNYIGRIGTNDEKPTFKRIELKHPFHNFFTNTPRGGSPPSDVIDLFGIADDSPNLRYARIRIAPYRD